MEDPCRELETTLDLYAEGELKDAAFTGLLERHLKTCTPCRRYLDRYHGLTRFILAGGLSFDDDDDDSRCRVERTWERIRFSPPPDWLAARDTGSAPAGEEWTGSRAGARAFRRVGSRLAAAALLGGVVALYFVSGWGSREGLREARTGEAVLSSTLPPGHGVDVRLASTGAPASAEGREAGDLWWVLDQDLSGPGGQGEAELPELPEFPALLYGFRVPAGETVAPREEASRACLRAEVLLATLPGGETWGVTGQRIFLVPGGWVVGTSAGETFEICRVRRLRAGAPDGGGREPQVQARLRDSPGAAPRLYRVFVGYDLRRSPHGRFFKLPLLLPSGSQSLLPPFEVEPKGLQLFTAPTSWH
jgi:hypothetical protein